MLSKDSHLITGAGNSEGPEYFIQCCKELQLAPREKAAVNYSQKLKDKFQHHPQIRRISRHRHLPKSIYSQSKELRVMKEARRRKERNVRKHSKPGSMPVVTEKEKHVVTVVK